MQNARYMQNLGQRLFESGVFSDCTDHCPQMIAARMLVASSALTMLDNDYFQQQACLQAEEAWQSNNLVL
jgi:hypothetical protein